MVIISALHVSLELDLMCIFTSCVMVGTHKCTYVKQPQLYSTNILLELNFKASGESQRDSQRDRERERERERDRQTDRDKREREICMFMCIHCTSTMYIYCSSLCMLILCVCTQSLCTIHVQVLSYQKVYCTVVLRD